MAHHDPSAQITGSPSLERAATGAVLTLALVLSALLFGSLWSAALYAITLVLFAAPGVSLASRFLGGPIAILAGAALGYFASSLGAGALARFGALTPWTMIAMSVGLYFLLRLGSSFVPSRAREEAPSS